SSPGLIGRPSIPETVIVYGDVAAHRMPRLRGGIGRSWRLRPRAPDLAAEVLAVQLFLLRGRGLASSLLGLALRARLLLGAVGPRLGAELLAFLLARLAFAADRLQIGFEIVGAVV